MIDPNSTEPVTLEGGCHCGEVRFTARLSGGWASARRCNCSYCEMRGAVALSADVGDFQITRGADVLATYTFNTGVARHHFCPTCGIYTHHRRRSNPNQYGINAAAIDGVSPFDFRDVPVNEGRNHPNDCSELNTDGIAGVVSYRPR